MMEGPLFKKHIHNQNQCQSTLKNSISLHFVEDPFMKKCVRDTNYVETFLHRKSQLLNFSYSTYLSHNAAEKYNIFYLKVKA